MGIATRSDGTPSSGNPNIVLATTRGGGHLGWFEGLRPIRWVSKPICEFISTLFEHTESTDTAAKLGGVEKSLWKRESAVQSKEVEIELLPVSATPAFPSASAVARSTKKVRGGEAVIMQKANGNGNGHEKGTPAAPEGKMAWLRTKMLEHAPLVHPSAAPGWTEPASRETLKLTMVRGARQKWTVPC